MSARKGSEACASTSVRKRARGECSDQEPERNDVVLLSGGFSLPERMYSDLMQGLFCDAELECQGGERIAVHRVVLAAGSEYFGAQFGPNWSGSASDASTNRFSLPSISFATCNDLLEFLYVGSCEVTKDSLASILEAAHYLQIWPLVNSAAVAMAAQLDIDNACSTWILADMLSLSELSRVARALVFDVFPAIVPTSSFCKLPLPFVRKIVSSDNLNASEGLVFEAVVKWIRQQPEKPPDGDIASLLSLVRFGLMSSDAIDRAQVDQTVKEHPEGLSILLKAMKDKAFGKGPEQRVPLSVLLDVTLCDLHGWTTHYDEPCTHKSTNWILRSVPADATYIMVGAQRPDGVIVLGAIGPRNEVLDLPLGVPHKIGGVYWYSSECLFGFSSENKAPEGCPRCQPSDGDTPEEVTHRLSWCVTGRHGGWRGRLGGMSFLPSFTWRKIILYRR